jgi:hypothetical protein
MLHWVPTHLRLQPTFSPERSSLISFPVRSNGSLAPIGARSSDSRASVTSHRKRGKGARKTCTHLYRSANEGRPPGRRQSAVITIQHRNGAHNQSGTSRKV